MSSSNPSEGPDKNPARRRRFLTAEKKFQIYLEAQDSDKTVGELLRREGLYSTDLARIRQQVKEGALQRLSTKPGRQQGLISPDAYEALNPRDCVRRFRTAASGASLGMTYHAWMIEGSRGEKILLSDLPSRHITFASKLIFSGISAIWFRSRRRVSSFCSRFRIVLVMSRNCDVPIRHVVIVAVKQNCSHVLDLANINAVAHEYRAPQSGWYDDTPRSGTRRGNMPITVSVGRLSATLDALLLQVKEVGGFLIGLVVADGSLDIEVFKV